MTEDEAKQLQPGDLVRISRDDICGSIGDVLVVIEQAEGKCHRRTIRVRRHGACVCPADMVYCVQWTGSLERVDVQYANISSDKEERMKTLKRHMHEKYTSREMRVAKDEFCYGINAFAGSNDKMSDVIDNFVDVVSRDISMLDTFYQRVWSKLEGGSPRGWVSEWAAEMKEEHGWSAEDILGCRGWTKGDASYPTMVAGYASYVEDLAEDTIAMLEREAKAMA